jgi:hypothetical protein
MSNRITFINYPFPSFSLVPKLCLGTHTPETPVSGLAGAKQSFAVTHSQTEFGNEKNSPRDGLLADLIPMLWVPKLPFGNEENPDYQPALPSSWRIWLNFWYNVCQ